MDNDSDHWASEREGELILDIIQGRSTISEVSRSNNIPPSAVKKWMEDARRDIEIALANQAAQEVYERIATLGRQVVEAFEEEPTLEEIKKQVDSWIAKGDPIMTITSSLANPAVYEQHPSRGCVEYIAIAYTFFLEGQQSIKGPNPSFALGSFDHAFKMCDTAERRLQSVLDGTCATDEDYENELTDKAREKARMAGQARSDKRYGPMKTEFARLLKEKKPDGGWKNKTQVVRVLEAAMTELKVPLEDGKTLSLTPDNLENTLPRWMREHPEVREAYESTRRRSIKN
ncbi:hypothetical protein [Alcaligenes faecalis]|uniref:hypothetical protein n=1 Tax=Alcaligenes aquatilis TaxID=323284 RepID=UPI002AA7FA2F|nr:hypothetical protein [Alcaligenes faecalis]